MSQVVEHFPSKHKVWSSNSTTKKILILCMNLKYWQNANTDYVLKDVFGLTLLCNPSCFAPHTAFALTLLHLISQILFSWTFELIGSRATDNFRNVISNRYFFLQSYKQANFTSVSQTTRVQTHFLGTIIKQCIHFLNMYWHKYIS
jgi:hypothetical protein